MSRIGITERRSRLAKNSSSFASSSTVGRRSRFLAFAMSRSSWHAVRASSTTAGLTGSPFTLLVPSDEVRQGRGPVPRADQGGRVFERNLTAFWPFFGRRSVGERFGLAVNDLLTLSNPDIRRVPSYPGSVLSNQDMRHMRYPQRLR